MSDDNSHKRLRRAEPVREWLPVAAIVLALVCVAAIIGLVVYELSVVIV